MALLMRQKILEVSFHSGTSTHLGGALSMTEIMAVLYGHILNCQPENPRWSDRDRFILSKGHGVLGFFPALLAKGFISEAMFNSFQTNGSPLIAHPIMNLDLGIESSTGSLGQGLPMAVGIAKAAKRKQQSYHTYTLIGDGEANEGAIWEAIMLAAALKLDNLTLILDANGMQNDGKATDILNVQNFAERFASFGWMAIEVEGHNLAELLSAFKSPSTQQKPKAIIANTTKGKGVPFMENQSDWHHNRLTEKLFQSAIAALTQDTSE